MSKRAPYPSLPVAMDSAPEFPKGHVELPRKLNPPENCWGCHR